MPAKSTTTPATTEQFVDAATAILSGAAKAATTKAVVPATKAPAKAAPAAKKAERTEVSTWVGRAISELAAKQRGSLGDKFKAAKPTSAGDRTVRLTKAESDALCELADKWAAAEGGAMKALSATALRGRLDKAWSA